MKLSYEDHNEITVLTLSGELTSDQADSFRRACRERFSNGVRDILIDVQHLNHIDSIGLELLLWLKDEASTFGGQLRLINPDDMLSEVLRVTRLDRRFDTHETIEAAAKSLRS